MIILISPFSRRLPNKDNNPKNFPHWEKLIELLIADGHSIIQLGIDGEKKFSNVHHNFNLDMPKVASLLKMSDMFICVDTWLQHMAHYYGKFGVVIWSLSDPLIYGYEHNLNILKDRKYLRPKQFDWWINDDAVYNEDAFNSAESVYKQINNWLCQKLE